MRVTVISHACVVDMNQEPFAALADEGVDVTVIAPRALNTDIRGRVELKTLKGSGATLVGLPVHLGGYRKIWGARGIHLIVYGGLKRAIQRSKPDVLFVEEEPYSLATWQAARIAKQMKIPFVVHENQNIARKVGQPFEGIRRFVLKHAAGVTIRNDAAQGIVRDLGFSGAVGKFPHGVEPLRFKPGERKTALPTPVIGFVGRLVPEKGIIGLIEAMRDVNGSLLVIGDGPLLEKAKNLAQGIDSHFTGALPHDDVPAWYASMDVVAIPSLTTPTWKEQFGRIIIEANAAGVPVVVSDSGSLPDTVTQTGGGLIVPEGDVALLREALAKLSADESWRHMLGDAGRAAVERQFTPRAIARELAAFLRAVTS